MLSDSTQEQAVNNGNRDQRFLSGTRRVRNRARGFMGLKIGLRLCLATISNIEIFDPLFSTFTEQAMALYIWQQQGCTLK